MDVRIRETRHQVFSCAVNQPYSSADLCSRRSLYPSDASVLHGHTLIVQHDTINRHRQDGNMLDSQRRRCLRWLPESTHCELKR